MKKIYVGNISLATTDCDLRTYFGQFGPVKNARTITTYESEAFRGFGFVAFENEAGALDALNYKFGHFINGVSVECKPAVSKADTENQRFQILTREDENLIIAQKDYVRTWNSMQEGVSEDINLVFRSRTRLGHPDSTKHYLKLKVTEMRKSEDHSSHPLTPQYKSNTYRATLSTTTTSSMAYKRLSARNCLLAYN